MPRRTRTRPIELPTDPCRVPATETVELLKCWLEVRDIDRRQKIIDYARQVLADDQRRCLN